jgi:hypothetical protein
MYLYIPVTMSLEIDVVIGDCKDIFAASIGKCKMT